MSILFVGFGAVVRDGHDVSVVVVPHGFVVGHVVTPDVDLVELGRSHPGDVILPNFAPEGQSQLASNRMAMAPNSNTSPSRS